MVDPCPESLRDPDGACSCGRTFSGLETDGLTTAAVVIERSELTPEQFRDGFWRAQGERLGCTCSVRERMPDELLSFASAWPAGTVLERHGRRVREKRSSASD